MLRFNETEAERRAYYRRCIREERRRLFIGTLAVPVMRLMHAIGLVSLDRLHDWYWVRDEARYALEEHRSCLAAAQAPQGFTVNMPDVRCG